MDNLKPRVIDMPADSTSTSAPGRLTPMETIWHRRGVVGLTIVACLIGAVIVYLLAPRSYTKSAFITVEPANVKVMGEGSNLESYLNTQAERINKQDAIHAGALTHLKADGLVALQTFAKADTDLARLAVIREHLLANTSKDNNLITISYTAPNPEESAYIVNAVVQAYSDLYTLNPKKDRNETLEKKKLENEKLEQEMHEKHLKLADLKGEISEQQAMKGGGEIGMQALKSLIEALTTARLEAINAQSAYEEFAKSAVPDPQKLALLIEGGRLDGVLVAPAHDDQEIKAEMSQAQQRLTELKERYLPNHPAVQAAQAKADGLIATYVLFLHHRWMSAATKVKDLDAACTEQERAMTEKVRKATLATAARMAAVDELEDALNRQKKQTDAQAMQIQELSALDQAGLVKVSVLTAADPTGQGKSKPVLAALLFEGLIIGLILGVTLTFIDQRVRSVEEITAATQLPVLGVVPHMPGKLTPQNRGRKVNLEPMSDVSEAVRGVRTALFFGPKAKTVLVTSATRAEGKSTLAANLAISIAEAGQRVLLLDADLREPTQHTIFSIGSEAGVSNVVSGKVAIDRAIHQTGIKGLDLLPCGPIPPNPSEAINNQNFADLLADLGNKYDYIVIDSPPVMAVTDARILGAMCDVTLLVVRAEKSSKRSASDARDGLMGFGANVLGVIVNDGPRNQERYGYYGGYGVKTGASTVGAIPAPSMMPQRLVGGRPALSATELMLAASHKR